MQLKIQAVTNEHFNANTYLLESKIIDCECYLIDIGNAAAVIKLLKKNQSIKGIFLTHAHLDHISGINEILAKFPKCTIFCSIYTKEALRDSKMNLSFYHNSPISYTGENIKVVNDKQSIVLFDSIKVLILETPGHNAGSLCFKINEALFTGDSLIPESAVVTKLKSGNKQEAKKSIIKIRNNSSNNSIIYPGHGKHLSANSIDWNFYL